MKLKPRARAAAPKRRHAWQILEAPADDQADKRAQRQQRSHRTRQRAWHVLEPPTGELPAVEPFQDHAIGPELPDETTVHLVLDLVTRIGEVQMANGAGASDVTATILALTRALGVPRCEVDVIFTSITVSCLRGSDLPPVTALRVVRSRSLDYTRLSETERLVQRLLRNRISAADAYTELVSITNAKHPYPRWVSTLAWGGMAGFITLLLGGTGWLPVISFVISAVVDRVGRLLNKGALPFFFQQVVGGFIATLAATAIVNIESLDLERPTLVVAAALTVLLSGLSTVSAVQDAITGYYVTASGRTLEVAIMSAGLITGVGAALSLATELGATHTPLPTTPAYTPLSLPVMMVAGTGAAACFALASYSKVRPLAVAAVAGAVGASAYGALGLAGYNQIFAASIAATLVGLGGGVLARRLKVTPLVVAVSGITPLLPGFSTYRGMSELVDGGNITTLMSAVAIGLALAAGVVLGEFLAQPVRTGLGRLERKLSGPRMAGPLNAGRPLE
ncbi:threonine/serine ThrE exporter family protein [Saccharomonospora piscinae]|uniref:Amino acid export carrier protein n=1 Tax=Saccharomonospora piscinae TaxID=687388 RepID=A0A1V9A6X0_SACPI|nr:threonine/serine exporter family protein [Saccharomonospora piscinae]OQO92798.1 amino acid export carrier protein [Saccharomonospora piscinae]TLW92935.1 threonine/serine exporter family protein [Saccharomonospora piscinae]